MSSEKVARLLTDFDLPDQQKGRSRVVPFDHTQHSSTKPQPKPPVPPAQREDDAYQRGRTEGYAAAAAEYEQKLNGESQKLRAVLTEERDKLLNDTAAKIARDIAEIGNQLETKIAAVTARVLERSSQAPCRRRPLRLLSSSCRHLRRILAGQLYGYQDHPICWSWCGASSACARSRWNFVPPRALRFRSSWMSSSSKPSSSSGSIE